MRLLILLFLVSCASLKSIDKPVCVEINMAKGYCTTIISGKGFYVDDVNKMDGRTWFENRPLMVLVPIDTYSSLKKYLINNCKRSKKCNANIDSWDRSMKNIDEQINSKVDAPEFSGNSLNK